MPSGRSSSHLKMKQQSLCTNLSGTNSTKLGTAPDAVRQVPSPHPQSGPGLQPDANRCLQTPTDLCNSQLAYHILLVHTFHMQLIPFISIEGTLSATNVARVLLIRSARHSLMYATRDAPLCVRPKEDACLMANTTVGPIKHSPESPHLIFPDFLRLLRRPGGKLPPGTNPPWGCQDGTLASGSFTQPRLQPYCMGVQRLEGVCLMFTCMACAA